ncbi:hypothetical protein JCM33374_g2167 [Metschnikowia sp. JCM 33374]|nr:hypothetical protein JCM33374_g2167 [Metschnikowia sp. JCM 33374]
MLGIHAAKRFPITRITCFPLASRVVAPRNCRQFSQLSWTEAQSRTPLGTQPPLRMQNSNPLRTLINPFSPINKTGSPRPYSTKTAPPPGPDKDVKGRALLHKITGFTTFSVSLLLVVAGVAFCGLVVYLILSELFLPSGDTKTFNKAVSLVEQNALAQEALGFKAGDRLKAYGEVPGDQWVRNRPVQSVRQKGQDGKDHLAMRFHVESDAGKHGSVFLEQIDTSFWSSEFAYVALELPSKKRIYIVEPKFAPKNYVPKTGVFSGSGFLGLNWGPKKD